MDFGLITNWLATLARLVVAFVFLVGGSQKLLDLPHFYRTIHKYELLPERLTKPIAVTIVWLEVLVGLCLLVDFFTRLVAALALFLLAVFTSIIVLILARGRQVDCGCFGKLYHNPLGLRELGRNIALIVFTITVLIYPH
jgi:uncharacterized membrane protein YphA (DoxX/SURF4 family)